jgi:hypothetical protein
MSRLAPDRRNLMIKTLTASIFTLIAAAAVSAPASAATLAALNGESEITLIDTATQKAMRTMVVKGAPGALAGIDVRPADGMLYGVTTNGTVVTIDAKTGQATQKVKLETFVAAGVPVTVDFNPAADRLRIIGADGTNLRANVDDGKVVVDGKLRYADADANKGATPMITAGAYSNSFKGTKETALYDIDGKLGIFTKQAPPNDGILGTIGMTGVKGDQIAFDIESDGNGGNTGWLMAGDQLMKIDIATGKTTAVGKVSMKGKVRDIAVLPAM